MSWTFPCLRLLPASARGWLVPTSSRPAMRRDFVGRRTVEQTALADPGVALSEVGKMTSKPNRFAKLPRAVRLEDTVGSVDTREIPDPEGGRDTDRDFLIRYGLGAL